VTAIELRSCAAGPQRRTATIGCTAVADTTDPQRLELPGTSARQLGGRLLRVWPDDNGVRDRDDLVNGQAGPRGMLPDRSGLLAW
jgi:hypothetical protein